MEKVCKNCRHWDTDPFDWTKEGYNDYTLKTKEVVGAKICNEIADAEGKGNTAFGVSDRAYTRHIETAPNFGCIHFKPKQ